MSVLTLDELSQDDNFASNLNIPQEIQSDISTRGFHLYEWISPSEFMITIQRDYLSIMDRYLFPMAVFSSIFATIGMVIGGTSGAFSGLLLSIALVYPIIFLILILRSTRRSFLFNHVANVVFTDKTLVFGQEIVSFEDVGSHKEMKVWEDEFDEPFLGESHLAKKKIIFFDSLLLKIKQIFEKLSHTADIDVRILPFAYLLGILFSIAIVVMYGIGVGFAWVLGLSFSFLNRFILRARNNQLYRINRTFLSIESSSNMLQNSSKSLVSDLSSAQKNEWMGDLIGRLNENMIHVSSQANTSVQCIILLRRLLESSSYSKIFNFSLFESWIRNQVMRPIDEIIALLEKNRETLQKTLSEAGTTTQNINNDAGKATIRLASDRLMMQVKSIDNQMILLKGYREKLR